MIGEMIEGKEGGPWILEEWEACIKPLIYVLVI